MCTLFLDLQLTWLHHTIINKNMQELVPRMGKCVIVSQRHWFSLCIDLSLVECNNITRKPHFASPGRENLVRQDLIYLAQLWKDKIAYVT